MHIDQALNEAKKALAGDENGLHQAPSPDCIACLLAEIDRLRYANQLYHMALEIIKGINNETKTETGGNSIADG